MKPYRSLLLILTALSYSIASFAQTDNNAKTLFNEGIALFDKGDFAGAADKYQQVLKINPKDYAAHYELAFTLYREGKLQEAIPYLDAIIKSSASKFEAYDLLGSIYDAAKQSDKAIEAFKAGIKEKPDFYRTHFNLAITYFETKKFADAEAEAIEALKLQPDHANSQRLYAMATYAEGKHINSLLAWCSFLMREPNTARSVEACNYIKHILYYSKNGNNIALHGGNEENNFQQIAIAMSATAGLVLPKAKDVNAVVSPLDSLSLPLPSIFKIAGEQKNKYGPPFFTKYFVDYFEQIANSNYMGVFSHYITLSVFHDEDVTWLKAHQDDVKGFQDWLKNTKREKD